MDWKLLQMPCTFGKQGLSSHSEETKKTARASPLRPVGDVIKFFRAVKGVITLEISLGM